MRCRKLGKSAKTLDIIYIICYYVNIRDKVLEQLQERLTGILIQIYLGGLFHLKEITLDEAKVLVSKSQTDSAIGHESTAQIMSTLLGINVPVNRQQFAQKQGQLALVFKLNGRPLEGQILTAEQIETIGYKWQILDRIE